ncbi:MAG: aldehyde ferredoxin oxidoreductase family protein, partial [Anaerovoracaceae bacterium]
SEIKYLELDKEIYRKFPGGSALGTYLLMKTMKAKIDPLSKENVVIFSTSLVTGMPFSGNSRMCVNAKSPLTNAIGDSQVGGYIGAQLKANGVDAIIVKGKAAKPVYLLLEQGKLAIKAASNLWGETVDIVEKKLKLELNTDEYEASIIGPAGENLVRYAAIIHRESRANGRNGMGAVMGSKMLKALVVKNTDIRDNIKPLNPEALRDLARGVLGKIEKNEAMEEIAVHGTAGYGDVLIDEGLMPSLNFSSGTFEGIKTLGGVNMSETILSGRETCYACGIRCKRVVSLEDKDYKKIGGPEFETCGSLGSYCGNNDLSEVAKANHLCNIFGLDTISSGGTISFAMDCYENGIISEADTEGLKVKFGENKIISELIPKIAKREGDFCWLLGEGSERAARKFGKVAEDLLVTSKGQEWPAHMAQMKPNLALHYAVNPFGPDHQTAEHDVCLLAPKDSQDWLWPLLLDDFNDCDEYGILDDNKAKYTAVTQRFYSAIDTLCLCSLAWGLSYQLYGPNDLVNMLKYTVDWTVSLDEIQEIGERKINLMRLFNQREGFSRKDDIAPEKAYVEIPNGENAGLKISKQDFETALDSYYKYAGWDLETGNPTEETLKRLGLDEFVIK